ncbi:hypothetical protein D9M70_562770 [compost metagenome]
MDVAQLQFYVGLVALLFAEQQAEVRMAAADLADAAFAGICVSHVPFERAVAGKDVPLVGATCFDLATAHQWQREIDRRAAGIGRYIQGKRFDAALQIEQRPVGQQAAGLAQHELAVAKKLAVQLMLEETPGVTSQTLGALFQLMVVVAVVLLQVLRA